MISGKLADILVAAYILASLYLRFKIEPSLEGHPFISVGVGLVLLLFIWALIKTNVIAPDYFGLLKTKEKKTSVMD